MSIPPAAFKGIGNLQQQDGNSVNAQQWPGGVRAEVWAQVD